MNRDRKIRDLTRRDRQRKPTKEIRPVPPEPGKSLAKMLGLDLAQIEAMLNAEAAQQQKANAKKEGAKQIQQIDVQRHEGPLLLPHSMPYSDAIAALISRMHEDEKVITLHERFDVEATDGAYCLMWALNEKFGWFPQPQNQIRVEVTPTMTIDVPWGTVSPDGLEGGTFTCDTTTRGGVMMFACKVSVKRKFEKVAREVMDMARQRSKTHSLYRGSAFELSFVKPPFMPIMPEIRPIDLSKIDTTLPVYAKPVQDAIHSNLFVPITRHRELKANGMSFKRGILLGGQYGTGKTLAAGVAAKLAVAEELTFIYVKDPQFLELALDFAAVYCVPGCVLFCEDIDQRMKRGEREATNAILNRIDGVDGKDRNIMVVFTTNSIRDIETALLRPGRLDAVIEVTPPDAKAAEQLVRKYVGGALDPAADLEKVGTVLAGRIPAVIAEVSKRAKLVQLGKTEVGAPLALVGADALLESAITMREQLKLLDQKPPEKMPLERALAIMGDALMEDSVLEPGQADAAAG